MGAAVVVVPFVGDLLRELAWALDLTTVGNFVLRLLCEDAAGTMSMSLKRSTVDGVTAFTSETEDCSTASDSRASFSMFTRLSLYKIAFSCLLLELGINACSLSVTSWLSSSR